MSRTMGKCARDLEFETFICNKKKRSKLYIYKLNRKYKEGERGHVNFGETT